jgi:hypothetical protein
MTILSKFKTNWEEFIVKDENWNTRLDINTITASDKVILVTLNMSTYVGYNQTGYSIPGFDRGITEQEAYNIWIQDFQNNQRTLIRQLKDFGLPSIPQCVYDGLILYYIINGDISQVTANEGVYELRDYIVNSDWDSLASAIKRSNFNRNFCSQAASIIRLSDYGKTKSRSWHRQTGIYEMRDKNDIDALGEDDLERARFAYYAETLKFLSKTPEGIKRTIAKQYDSKLVVDQFTYSGSSVFTISTTPSMEPVEKLKVEINGEVIQHFFDFTLLNNVITITKTLNTGDIVRFTTKI